MKTVSKFQSTKKEPHENSFKVPHAKSFDLLQKKTLDITESPSGSEILAPNIYEYISIYIYIVATGSRPLQKFCLFWQK